MTARKFEINYYSDSLYKELFEMKSKLDGFAAEIERLEGYRSEALKPYVRHLHELTGFIDWKLEIFNKVCPVDWSKYIRDLEDTVSVPLIEATKEGEEIAGGYVGG